MLRESLDEKKKLEDDNPRFVESDSVHKYTGDYCRQFNSMYRSAILTLVQLG